MSCGLEGRGAALAAVALALAWATLFGLFVRAAWPFTVDDAYITFRYAENLAAGHGPTWNPGQPPVEGYTTFLWMLVMAVPHALGLAVVPFSKWTGLLCMLLATASAAFMVARLAAFAPAGVRVACALGCAVLLASLRPAALHAVSGMETAGFTLLLTLFFAELVRLQDAPGASFRRLALLGLLAGLTRPEGSLIAGVGFLGLFARLPAGQRPALARSVALWMVLPGAVYFGWRLAYYGVLFPLPFYVGGLFGSARPGSAVVMEYAGSLATSLGLFVALGAWRVGRPAAPVLLAALVVPVFYWVPVHRMAYGFRYLFPVVPVLAAFAFVGLASLLVSLRARPFAAGRAGPVWTAAVFAAALLWMSGTQQWEFVRHGYAKSLAQVDAFATTYRNALASGHVPLGHELRALGDAGHGGLLAIADAGAVPYYSGWQTLDTFGLNDAHIALEDDYDPAYVLGREPDLLVLLSKSRKRFEPMLPWAQALHDAAHEAGYETIDRRGRPHYALWLLARPDGPVADALRASGAPP